MNNIFQQLGYIIPTYVATDYGRYRKPSPLIFPILANGSNIDEFTFVGDAAGRNGDHSDSDVQLAVNIQAYYQIPCYFMTPEQFFLNQNIPPALTGFDPTSYTNPYSSPLTIANNLEIVLLVGRPASGKSTIAKWYHSHGYVIISKDLKNDNQAFQTLSNGYRIIIDNTNPSIESRRKYVMLSQQFNIPIRLIYVDIPLELSQHLNSIRTILGGQHIPSIAYNIYQKNFQLPGPQEGYSEMTAIGFSLDNLLNPDFTKLFYMRLV